MASFTINPMLGQPFYCFSAYSSSRDILDAGTSFIGRVEFACTHLSNPLMNHCDLKIFFFKLVIKLQGINQVLDTESLDNFRLGNFQNRVSLESELMFYLRVDINQGHEVVAVIIATKT